MVFVSCFSGIWTCCCIKNCWGDPRNLRNWRETRVVYDVCQGYVCVSVWFNMKNHGWALWF
jgi:hypothetical protein